MDESQPALPRVLSQIQTNYDPEWAKTRQQNVGLSGFETALEGADSLSGPHGGETVGWLAIQGSRLTRIRRRR